MITNSHAGGGAAIRTVTTYAVADNGAYYSIFRDLTDAVVAAVDDVEISTSVSTTTSCGSLNCPSEAGRPSPL